MKKRLMLIAAALITLVGISANAQDAPRGPQNKMRQPMEFTEFAFEGILLDQNQQQRIDSLNNATKAKMKAQKGNKGQGPMGQGQCQQGQCPKGQGQCQQDQCPKGQGQCQQGQCPKGQGQCQQVQCPKGQGQCQQGQCPKQQQCAEAPACAAAPQCKMDRQNCPNDSANCGRRHGGKGMGPGHGANPFGEEYIAKVKEILTPDQYVVFLENIVSMPTNRPNMKGGPMQKAVAPAPTGGKAKQKAGKKARR